MNDYRWEERTYDEFRIYFPRIEKEVVKCTPRRDLEELILDMSDGSRYIYDAINNSLGTLTHEIDRNKMTEVDWYEEFAYVLKRKMYVEGISQKRLSEMTNISQAMISMYVTGRSIPSVYNAVLIAKALKCDVRDLLLW